MPLLKLSSKSGGLDLRAFPHIFPEVYTSILYSLELFPVVYREWSRSLKVYFKITFVLNTFCGKRMFVYMFGTVVNLNICCSCCL